ncbi:polyprenol monophosphomannose synthase [Amycolatopsis roodepoortensis]|uniref:Dolichol-phosphate mannosyltransferase n=1 Tax=Amycolatopsis roodepoortensis TaxID=700274 RepID=A0ABR9LJ23_9PSEU|nr:polyprenol monophosphomannose synthase [Amycolatopsis roodepoortensis]MBE1580547.1 dolichol-phosphate mannosyltransferase [Amycolatopsis roodepoortensis]
MNTRVGVVVPTYQEAATIGEALKRLHDLPIDDLLVVVVDDGSPDGTADFAEKAAADWPAGRRELTILRRTEKSGLGRAYIAGMAAALDAGCDLVIEMDADLSHPAAAIPGMVERAAEGADVVIGSRYTTGGQLDADWPLSRRLLSRAANFYVSVLLRLKLRDVTAGFVAWTAETLRAIDVDTINSNGYSFQVEMKWRARNLNATIVEVPITFSERAAGSSKMDLAVKIEGLKLPWRLLFTRRPRG